MDGFNWKQYRKNCPVPSGLIPYGKYSYQDPRGNVYSLDKFRPRFPVGHQLFLAPDPLNCGKFLPPSESFAISQISLLLQSVHDEYGLSLILEHGDGRRRGNLHWWKFFGGIITLQKWQLFGSPDPNYYLVMEFNPNKTDVEPWRKLRERCVPQWSNTRIDYALDIPYPISDVRLLTRKEPSTHRGTYYFGARGSSGYTRVYDKRKQMREVFKTEIGKEVTRIEWESHQSDPLTMDFPYLIGDLGQHEVLRFVPMNDWPAALRTYNPKTAAKIRKSCLSSVPVDGEIFYSLRDELLSDMGLYQADCLDHIEKYRLDEAQADELESIQSALRKWAKVDH